MRFFGADESKANARALFELWRRGDWQRRPVAGESFHQSEIRALLPRLTKEQQVELAEQALLIPEPGNRHDRNAVKVVIRGQHVGYLSSEDAPLYQPLLQQLLAQGLQPVVPATIWAREYDKWTGTDRRGRDTFEAVLSASVTLALDEPHLCVPANLPPSSPHALLPFGAAIQIKGEEEHLDTLVRYLHPAGEQWAYATLVGVERQSTRTSKVVVEVLLDGAVVGELTPTMSTEFLPIVQGLAEVGKTCAARVIVKGNALKADVVLHSAKAGALDQAWLSANLRTQPGQEQRVVGVRSELAPSDPPAPTHSVPAAGGPAAKAQHPPIPPRPTRIVFRVPSSWPQPPEGWEPPAGWQPPAEWPLAPADWRFWSAE